MGLSKQKENKFQAKVLSFLKKEVGGYWIDIVVSTYQSKGEPDIVGCKDGQFYAFELKVDDYKASEAQKEKLRRINLSGGVAMEVRSIDELRELFNVYKV